MIPSVCIPDSLLQLKTCIVLSILIWTDMGRKGVGHLETITLSIDGKRVHCPPGTSILDVADQNGIKIPTLCNPPDLKHFGACRICIV